MDHASPRPVIGITSSLNLIDYEYAEQQVVMVPHSYAHCVEAAGACAVIIPEGASPSFAREVIGRLDGLIIAGGRDVHSDSYGQPLHPKTTDAPGPP